MKNLRIASVAGVSALAVVLGLGSLALVRAQPTTPAKPTIMGMVDITKIEKELKEVQTITSDMQMRRAATENEGKKKSEALQQMKSDLDLFQANPVEREKKIAEIQQAAIELEVWSKVEQSKLVAEFARQHERLYRKIISTIGQVAKENSVDMVVMKEPEINLMGAAPENIAPQIMIRKLLWANDNVPDLTQRVIARMDNEFNNPTPGTPGSGTPGTPGSTTPGTTTRPAVR